MTKIETRFKAGKTHVYVEKNVKSTDLFKVVYGQPYLSLGIENTAQVTPSHCKVGLSLNGFQVTSLEWVNENKNKEKKHKTHRKE